MKVVWLVLASMVVAAEARATCIGPMWLGTSPETPVPVRGSLFAYDESYGDAGSPQLTWAHGTGTWSKTRVSESVWRVDYAAIDATAIVVEVGYQRATYPIDRGWRAPAQPPRVKELWHLESSWTCSRTDSVNLGIDQETAVYRVHWTFAGERQQWIIPASGRVLELGEINCGGTTIPPEQLHRGGRLALTAIRVDGSEVPVLGVPASLLAAALPLHGRGRDRDWFDPLIEPLPTTQDLADDRRVPHGLELLGILGLIAALAALSACYARRVL